MKARYTVGPPWADVCEEHKEASGADHVMECLDDVECVCCEAERLGQELVIKNPLCGTPWRGRP